MRDRQGFRTTQSEIIAKDHFRLHTQSLQQAEAMRAKGLSGPQIAEIPDFVTHCNYPFVIIEVLYDSPMPETVIAITG